MWLEDYRDVQVLHDDVDATEESGNPQHETNMGYQPFIHVGRVHLTYTDHSERPSVDFDQ